jgi:hypothetical protein
MGLSVLARSTAEERRPARPKARRERTRQERTMTAPPELRAPQSSAHPRRLRRARPKMAPRSGAAQVAWQAGPNLPRRALKVLRAWRASVGPMREPADSTMWPAGRQAWTARPQAALPTTARALRAGWLEAQSGPPALPTKVPVRRELPTTERPVVPQGRAEAKPRVHPRKARARRQGVRVVVRSSSEQARRGRRETPTSRAVQVSYPREGWLPRASPRSARERLKATRAHPTTAKRPPKASPGRLRAGPSWGLTVERQSSGRPGSSAAPQPAEPTSRQRRRSGCSGMPGAPEAPPSSSGVGGASSDIGSRRKAPPPPKLCLRIQLASGWRAPFADSGWVSVT